MLRNQGMRRRYHHDELGWNARMDGFQGAVLTIKLKYIGVWNETRCELASSHFFLQTPLANVGASAGVRWAAGSAVRQAFKSKQAKRRGKNRHIVLQLTQILGKLLSLEKGL